jgi:hypothetical protein
MSSEQFDNVCRDEFAEINAKLDKLDIAIRGNGRPGIIVRLDRLEAAERSRSRVLWLIAGSVVTIAANALWHTFFGAG